jgi:ATP-binding cassette subfamily B (MDR/TAP) protein 1
MLFIIFGLIFYIGALFVKDVGVSVSNVFTAIYGIVFSAIAVGNTFHFSPDLGVAKVSAANLFEILDC